MHSRFDAEGKPGVTTRSRLELLDVVERRPAHDGLLPQHGRPADRDRSATRRRWRFRSCRDASSAERRPAVPDHAADVALPPVDRLLDHRQLRGARLRVSAIARDFSSTSTGWGKNAIERGNTDTWTIYPRRIAEVKDGDREGRAGAAGGADSRDGRRRPHRARCRRSTTRSLREARVARSARLHPAGRSGATS